MQYDCLVVDDERILADNIAQYFCLFDVSCAAASGAEECEAFLSENSARVLILDVNLGDGSGFALCKKLREKLHVPILFMSARTSDEDKIAGLTLGGDDYIEKPCSLSVLLAKVKAVLRRCDAPKSPIFSDGRVEYDPTASCLTVDGRKAHLTAMENRLLSYLVENEGRVVPKDELLDAVWGSRFTSEGTLSVHVRRLRVLLEKDPANPAYIETARGTGYRFRRPDA